MALSAGYVVRATAANRQRHALMASAALPTMSLGPLFCAPPLPFLVRAGAGFVSGQVIYVAGGPLG